jgi:glucose-6-phosphate dehydrogenase assembly protein OpcA
MMASSDGLQELAAWSDPATDAGGIQLAMDRLWREASSSRVTFDGQSPNDGGIVRTRVANLITYSSAGVDVHQLEEELRVLATQHPIRSILFEADPTLPAGSTAATVRAYCRPASGRKVSFEHIQISSGDTSGPRLASMVSQLLVRDLPTILWWAGSPSFTSTTFADLASLADLVVFDTAKFAVAVDGLAGVGDGLKRYRSRIAIADLNWNRLADWREVIAQFFDHNAALGAIGDIREIEISVSPMADNVVSAQALLLVSWLASRLGWSFAAVEYGHESAQFRMTHDETSINVSVVSGGGKHRPAGTICSVRIEAGPVELTQRFWLSSDADACGTASAEYAPGQSASRRFSLVERSTSDLIADELEAFGKEHALDDALDFAVALAARLRSTQPSQRSDSRSA